MRDQHGRAMNRDDIPPASSFPAREENSSSFDTSTAHHARVYDYLLGGKDNFAADRSYVDTLTATYPGTVTTARANRAFLGRAVRFLATEAGISQFLDIGTGIPSPGNTQEAARDVRPDARIVYVDNDPVVLAHARALLTSGEHGATDYLDADIRKPEKILQQAAATLDFTRPIGVLLLFILHVIDDADDPHRIVATIMDAMPRGSYLALTHAAADLLDPGLEETAQEINRRMSAEQYICRDKAAVGRFFDGLEMVDPGLVRPEEWRPDPDAPAVSTVIWAGVARKP